MIKPQSRKELIESLTPLVLPLIRDKAKVSNPIPGNSDTSVVYIQHEGLSAYISSEMYETLRLDVLLYVQNYLNTESGLFLRYTDVKAIIKNRLEQVFDDI